MQRSTAIDISAVHVMPSISEVKDGIGRISLSGHVQHLLLAHTFSSMISSILNQELHYVMATEKACIVKGCQSIVSEVSKVQE